MEPSSHVVGEASKVEGAVLGKSCVMFGRDGPVAGAVSYQVSAPRGDTVRHFVADLTPRRRYALAGANEAAATVSPAGVIAFTTTGTGAAQTLSLSPD